MFYKLDINGFYLGIQRESNEGMEFYTEVNPTGNFIRHRFDGENWVEGATEEEIQAKEIDIIVERKRQQHAELLETDWYVVRFAETGVPIPQEIIDLRNQIRNKYESI